MMISMCVCVGGAGRRCVATSVAVASEPCVHASLARFVAVDVVG